jgi:hypothetical protein
MGGRYAILQEGKGRYANNVRMGVSVNFNKLCGAQVGVWGSDALLAPALGGGRKGKSYSKGVKALMPCSCEDAVEYQPGRSACPAPSAAHVLERGVGDRLNSIPSKEVPHGPQWLQCLTHACGCMSSHSPAVLLCLSHLCGTRRQDQPSAVGLAGSHPSPTQACSRIEGQPSRLLC